MTELAHQLAALTEHRDRDAADATLLRVLETLVQPECALLCQSVGRPPQQSWATRAYLQTSGQVHQNEPPWIQPDHLPTLAAHPQRLEALERDEVTEHPLPDGGTATIFPLSTAYDLLTVLELHTRQELPLDQLRLVSGALRIHRNFQALLDDSERDTLTGLLNRKTFDDTLYKVLESTRPETDAAGRRHTGSAFATPHYMAVIDIDHFKSVNDRFGHLIGDEVLLLVSRLMRSTFRHHDRLYRFGGEEFVVLMRCGAEHVHGAFERLRQTIASYRFPQIGELTISIGYSALRAADTPSSAFERADKAVYWAKNHGRNQVCDFATLQEAANLAGSEGDGGEVELF